MKIKELLSLIKRFLSRNLYREDCRCCGDKLHKPGGCGAAWVGSGFCHRCMAKILKN